MSRRFSLATSTALAVLGALGLLAPQAVPAQTAPPSLQVANATAITTLSATGVQIYTCQRDAGTHQLSWVFKAPQADLFDATGHLVVKHFAGPSWEAFDGSLITGKVLEQFTAEAGNIPQLLLQATQGGGRGLLSPVRFVQRLNTHGGLAPTQACAREGQEGRSPYTATYVFLD